LNTHHSLAFFRCKYWRRRGGPPPKGLLGSFFATADCLPKRWIFYTRRLSVGKLPFPEGTLFPPPLLPTSFLKTGRPILVPGGRIFFQTSFPPAGLQAGERPPSSFLNEKKTVKPFLSFFRRGPMPPEGELPALKPWQGVLGGHLGIGGGETPQLPFIQLDIPCDSGFCFFCLGLSFWLA